MGALDIEVQNGGSQPVSRGDILRSAQVRWLPAQQQESLRVAQRRQASIDPYP